MSRIDYRLTLALLLSLLLHLAPPLLAMLADLIEPSPPPAPPPLQVSLPAPPAKPAAVPLKLDETPPLKTAPVATQKILTRPDSPQKTRSWQSEIRQQLEKQQRRGEFYPPEAIAQGLEGEVLVLMVLNENGQVVAARVEQSSGHRLLDDAALRAIRALSSLPADTPQNVVLPVRFRLR